MPRSFLVKSKRAHSYHLPRYPDDDCSALDAIVAHACAGGSVYERNYAAKRKKTTRWELGTQL